MTGSVMEDSEKQIRRIFQKLERIDRSLRRMEILLNHLFEHILSRPAQKERPPPIETFNRRNYLK